MQLRFVRSCLIISLLTSNEAKVKTKFQETSPEIQEMNLLKLKSLQNVTLLKNKYRDYKLSLTQVLAEKLANEALKSPKMQEEFKRLGIGKTDQRNSRGIKEKLNRKASAIRFINARKGYYKPSFKGPKRKKRKRHRCGFGLGWCSDSDFSKHDTHKKAPTKIHQEEIISKRETGNPTLQVIHSSDDSKIIKARKPIVRESMLERVMKTTTKDPNKKNPSDPGMEYSEYYNDDDVNDAPVGKIQTKDDDSKIRSGRQITNDKFYNIKNKSRLDPSINKVKINQKEDKFQELEANPLQKSYGSLNGDDEFNDDSSEDEEGALDGNESNIFFSDSDQNQNKAYQKNQVQMQNQVNEQNQIYNRNPVYQQNPFLLSDVENYRNLAQQPIGLTSNPQIFYPNQYNNQFKYPNQNFSSINKPPNQIVPNKDINSNYRGSNYKINQSLASVKEPQQLYPGIEAIPTISESTSLSPLKISASTTGSISKPTYSSTKKLCSTDDHSTNLTDNVTSSTPLLKSEVKQNLKPMNSLIPLINQGHVVEREEQKQLNSKLSTSDTHVIADQILTKIVDELEDLKAGQFKKSHREGRPCRLAGIWETFQAGVKLNMKVVKHNIMVTTEKLESSLNNQGILNTSWNLSGQVPFRHKGPFSLTGVNNKTKSLAVFVGSCRVCQGIDTIEGIWTLSREPHDCRDFQMATGIYNDIFRRMRHHTTKRKRQNKSSTTGFSTISSSTSISTKSESTPAKV